MAVYLSPLTDTKIALGVWIFSGIPVGTPAYHLRLEYDAYCSAIWDPLKHHALLRGLSTNGSMEHKDYKDIGEVLATDYGVTVLEWERANGKRIKLLRVGPRRWLIEAFPMKHLKNRKSKL